MKCIKKWKKYLLYYENAKNIEINGRIEVKKSGKTTEYYQTLIQDNIKIRKYIKKYDVSLLNIKKVEEIAKMKLLK